MKPFIKILKLGILRFINHFGYSILKLPPKPRKTSKVISVLIGGKAIKIHSGNPLCFQYKHNPQYNCSIGIMAALVKDRFPTAWAVDVGANVGDTLAIIKGKASLPVICVEGDAFCYDLLQENARQFKDVHTFNAFLSDQPGEVMVETQKAGWNTTLTDADPNAGGQKVRFKTLDQLVQELSRQVKIGLLKVDTEGYDMRILRGAAGILASDRPVITFELNRENIEPLEDSVADFFDYLTGLGYQNFILNDSGGRFICTITGSDRALWLDLYHYSGLGQPIYYYDVWGFHNADQELFEQFLAWQKMDREGVKAIP